MSRLRPAEVQFYFDADLLGLAKILAPHRHDFTYPGDPGGEIRKRLRPPCPIARSDILDVDWIPPVAAHGWIAVTRDARIQHRPAELAAVRDHAARLVNLDSADAGTKWGQLEVFMARWRRIEALLERPGPFILSVSRTAFRDVELRP